MRWTGSAMRVSAVIAGVMLAVGVTAPAGVASDAGDREYKVQPGDTLWGIAGSELGDPYRWPEIAVASAPIVQPGGMRLGDPDLIRPGWTLALPKGGALSLVSGVSGATDLSVGGDHSCAVVTGGRVVCWRNKDQGRTVQGVTGATDVAVGWAHTCAVVARGKVLCWGRNDAGQLGNGSTANEYGPVPVSGVSGATAVAAGDAVSCAVIPGGKVTCWGSNWSGLLGDGTMKDSPSPVLVYGVSDAVDVAANWGFACALIADGSVTCWGNNEEGYSGRGAGGISNPGAVPGVSGATAVSLGAAERPSCAIVSGGKLSCWGPHSQESSTLSGVASLALGGAKACAVVTGGQVNCWRGSSAGGGEIVSGVAGATAISTGARSSCAVITGGRVTCWEGREPELEGESEIDE